MTKRLIIKPLSAEECNMNREKYSLTWSRRVAKQLRIEYNQPCVYRLPNGCFAVLKEGKTQ